MPVQPKVRRVRKTLIIAFISLAVAAGLILPAAIASNSKKSATRIDKPKTRAQSKKTLRPGANRGSSPSKSPGGLADNNRMNKSGSLAHQSSRPGNDEPDEAARQRLRQMQDENGKIPENALMRAMRQKRRMERARLTLLSPQAQLLSWTSVGPGNIGGRIRSVLVSPANPSTMWIGGLGGGIWKTTTGGSTWSPTSDFIANLVVSCMAMDPLNSNVIYAGTGEVVAASAAVPGAGIFKTTDGGTTWAQLPSTANSDWFYVSRIAIDPNNSQVLLATADSGIWKSTNGGTTWQLRNSNSGRDLSFHPTDSTQCIASGIFPTLFSTDGGTTWSQAVGIPVDIGSTVKVAYSRSNPSIVYASANFNGGSVYRSVDGGRNYSLRSSNQGFFATQGNYNNIVWVDPTNSNNIIVGGIQLYSSTDGGVTFTQFNSGNFQEFSGGPLFFGSIHVDQHMVVEHPSYAANRTVFIGNDGGIYKVSDVFTPAQTVRVNLNRNLAITQFYAAAGNASTGLIVGGTQDNSTLLNTPAQCIPNSSAETEDWVSTIGGDGGFCAIDPTDPTLFYGEFQFRHIQRVRLTGCNTSWTEISSGISDFADFISPFIMDPNNPNTLLAGGGPTIWRTTQARTITTEPWQQIKSAVASGFWTTAIAVAPGNSNIIWVGHQNGEVYKTTNGTAASPTWTRVDPVTLPDRYLTRIAIHPTNPNTVYLTFGGFSPDNVWVTTNGGTSWSDVSGNLPDAPVRTMVIDPQVANRLFVGTEIGVFSTSDGGVSWFADGPANVSVDDLFWMGSDLVAATYGRGIFRAQVAGGNPPPIVAITSPLDGATFTAPANITINATASDSNGTVTKVDFFQGSTLIGTDTTSPYSIAWSSVAAGSYMLTARATDNGNATTTSSPINITVTGNSALFVVGSTTLSTGDTAIRNRLTTLGFTVTIRQAAAATSGDATGKSLVVISESVTSTSVNTKFRNVAVPVLSMEPLIFDDMLMTGATSGTNFGSTTSQTRITMVTTSHPMAAGRTGTPTVVSASRTFGWGVPNSNAVRVANISGSSTRAAIFGYTTGATMFGGLTAPARRVGWFASSSAAAVLNSNGLALFDAAVRWASGT